MDKADRVGALWVRKYDDGGKKITGTIEITSKLANLKEGDKINIVVYDNKYHEEGDNKPNYNIVIRPPKQEEEQGE